jgi:hypothetical protein
MKREEENLKERREKEDSKKVGAHNFLSSKKTPRKRHHTTTRNYNFLKHATQNVAGDMLVSKSGFEPRGTESRRSTTPSHGNMRLRLSSTETLKRVLVVPPTKIRIWT